MYKKQLIPIILFLTYLTFISCSNNNKFEVDKGKVGEITKETTIQELNKIFEKDSIVKNLSEGALGDSYFQEDDEYFIYEKGGKHLLTIVPKEQLDSTSIIKNIEIFDSRYQTKTGLSLSSTFSEVNANNNINRIESTFSSATLFIDDYNATVAINKEELGLKEFSTQKVTLAQIPDLAKIKSFVVWFH